MVESCNHPLAIPLEWGRAEHLNRFVLFVCALHMLVGHSAPTMFPCLLNSCNQSLLLLSTQTWEMVNRH